MTVFNDTALSHEDLYERLQSAMTGAEAAADGVAWTLLWSDYGPDESRMWLQAPGNSSDDGIYLWVRHFRDTGAGYYNIELLVSSGWSESLAETPTSQTGASSYRYLTLHENAIDYWFLVNAQRLVIVAKVGTKYMSAYAGWYLPQGTPAEHPIPLYIGGTSTSATTVHTSTADGHASWWARPANGQLRHFDGTFLTPTGVWPWPESEANLFAQAPGNSYVPLEAVLYSTSNGGNVYGALDGVYYISGDSNSPENTFVWGSSTYLVFQDVFRTANNKFCCIKLE